MKKQYWIIIGAVVAVLAIGAGLFFWLGNNGPEPGKPQAFAYIYHNELCYPILNGQQNGDPIKIDRTDSSADGSVTCVLTAYDELILFTLSGRKTIANEVNSFSLSDDGKIVSYTTADNARHSYNTSSNAYDSDIDNKASAYINDADQLMLKANGTEKFIANVGPHSDVIGLSVEEGHIHVQSRIDGDTVIFHYDLNGQRSEILRTESSRIFPMYGSMKQMLIAPVDGPSYISIDCQPAIKMADYWIEPMFVVNGRADDPEILLNWAYCTAEGEIWYIADDPANPIVLVKDIKIAKCDPSGRYIWYVKNNDLWRLDTRHGTAAEEKAVKIAENLLDLTVRLPYAIDYYNILEYDMRFTEDFSHFYYLKDKSIYLVDAMNGGEMMLIAEGVTKRCFITENGMMFYLKDSTAYSYWNGVSTELVTGVESIGRTDPYHMYAKLSDSTYYITDGVTSYNVTLNIA